MLKVRLGQSIWLKFRVLWVFLTIIIIFHENVLHFYHFTTLIEKQVLFDQSNKWEEHFQKLMFLLTKTSILSLIVEGKDFIGFYNALNFILCSMLMQDRNVIAYASRKLMPLEKYQQTLELKLAVVVFELKIWGHYLYNVMCEVFINHCNLYYFLTQRNFNLRKKSWFELLIMM